jgi:uncharacterized membrane protein YqjE
METIKTVFEAFGIFAISVLVMWVLWMVTHRHVATGVGWVNYQGPLFVMVGLWYVAFGVFLFLYRR